MIILEVLKYIALTAVFLMAIVIISLVIWSWNRQVLLYSVKESGDPIVWNNRKAGKITVQQALALAEPYLQESLEKIRRRRGGTQ